MKFISRGLPGRCELCRLSIFSVDSWSNMTHIKDEEDDFCLIRVIDILTNQIIKIKIVDISNLYFIQIGLNKHRKYVNGKMERQNVAYTAPSNPHKRSHIYNWPGC